MKQALPAMSKAEWHQYEGFVLAVLKLKTRSFKGSYWQFGLFELVRTENNTVFFDFKSIEFDLQKHRFWTSKEVSLERKGIGFEKGVFFTSKSGLFATKSVLFRNNT